MENGPICNPAARATEENGRLKVTIWGARTQYANVNRPRPATQASAGKSAKPPQYDCEFLLPKTAAGALEAVAAIRAFAQKKFAGKKWHSAVLKDGDRELEDLANSGVALNALHELKRGCWVFRANSGVDHPPAVRGEIYSGCYAGAIINVAAYSVEGDGIKGYLNGCQFQGDGERLGGSVINVEDEFGIPTPASHNLPEIPENDFTAGLPGYGAAPNKSQIEDDLPF